MEHDYLKSLVGWTIVRVQDSDPADPFSAPALLLRRRGSGGKPGGRGVWEYKGAFVLRDPEGNGPGHLDIVDAEGP